MSRQFVKYGEKTTELPEGMTLTQVKQQMARFFPELADPEVKTEKKGEDTIHTFSKKAGRKGAGRKSAATPLATLTGRLRKVRETPVAPPALVAVVLQAADDTRVDLETTLDAMQSEARAVREWRETAQQMPPCWPAQNSQGLLL